MQRLIYTLYDACITCSLGTQIIDSSHTNDNFRHMGHILLTTTLTIIVGYTYSASCS